MDYPDLNPALSIFLTLLIFLAGGESSAVSSSSKEILIGYSSIGHGYDANGNTTSSSSPITNNQSLITNVADVYSFDNKLIHRTRADGVTIDLTHNPDGHRLIKLVAQNGLTQRLHHYLTDANNPTGYAQVIEEKDPFNTANPLRKLHLYGHDLILSEKRGTAVACAGAPVCAAMSWFIMMRNDSPERLTPK